MPSRYAALTSRLADLHDGLARHRVYTTLSAPTTLARFMESHVFAVWDFMTLLKTLQVRLTCTRIPWTPPSNRQAARFVNEIVLGEESDEVAPGVFTSHYELYLDAMYEVGADTSAVRAFVAVLQGTGGACSLFREAASLIPPAPRAFVTTTLSLCDADTPAVAAAFLLGRERLVPSMFDRMLRFVGYAPKLRLYLERHVELDGETHGPLAEKLLVSVAGEDDCAWESAEQGATRALEARRELWDRVAGANESSGSGAV